MDEGLQDLIEHIMGGMPDAITGHAVAHGELTVHARAERIVPVLKFLRDNPACGFSVLIDIAGVDYPERNQRFDVVYHLLSMHQNQRLRIKVEADEETLVPSAADIFPAAGWYEREIFDFYGVMFSGHPDLRRILTDYGFDGHPMRKDFPLTGFVQVRYDDDEKRVVYEPVELIQEFRSFDFASPWEGADYALPGDEKGDEKASDGADEKKA